MKSIDKPTEADCNCGCQTTASTEGISMVTTILALINCMIGGAAMVIPQIGLKTGWGLTILVIVVVGFISYYTSYLIVLHLGKCRNIRLSILAHFDQDQRYLTGYGFLLFLSIIPTLLIYFKIICLQLQGLIGYHSDWLAPGMALFLIFAVIVIRVKKIGQQTLALGIVSILTYILFLVWAQFSAPAGPKTVPIATEPMSLIPIMFTAFSCQQFMVQNIIKHKDQKNYMSICRWTYICAVLIFSFIGEGSFAIVNREGRVSNPEIITDYFKMGQWQNKVIEAIYVVHILTAFPNFLLISKLRFHQIFGIQIKCNITWHEVLYIAVAICLCCAVFMLGVRVEVLITIKGAVFGFIYMVIIPVWIHFRCVFVNKGNGYIQGDEEYNSQITSDGCECENVYNSKWTLRLETAFLAFVVLFGFFLMVYTLHNLITK